jgi:hypothetical protein
MKRRWSLLKSCLLSLLVTVALSAGFGRAWAFEEDNLLPGEEAPSAPVTLSQATRGVVFYTAAINASGTPVVASCFGCNIATTLHLATGQYQVGFNVNVQATNGWSRWVQADTLTIGSENAWCNTADRAGVPRAIYVNCQTSGGPGSMGNSKPVDTSFFLFVAR